MNKRILIFIVILLPMLAGCSKQSAPELIDEPIEKFEVTEEKFTEKVAEPVTETMDAKFAQIAFQLVSGSYSRNVIQDDMAITEMFILDKHSFVRIVSNDVDQEVFAYNYVSDDFTYMYYFDGEMISKTVFNIATGAILQDEEGYAELLKVDAEELKTYFNDLIQSAQIELEELRE